VSAGAADHGASKCRRAPQTTRNTPKVQKQRNFTEQCWSYAEDNSNKYFALNASRHTVLANLSPAAPVSCGFCLPCHRLAPPAPAASGDKAPLSRGFEDTHRGNSPISNRRKYCKAEKKVGETANAANHAAQQRTRKHKWKKRSNNSLRNVPAQQEREQGDVERVASGGCSAVRHDLPFLDMNIKRSGLNCGGPSSSSVCEQAKTIVLPVAQSAFVLSMRHHSRRDRSSNASSSNYAAGLSRITQCLEVAAGVSLPPTDFVCLN